MIYAVAFVVLIHIAWSIKMSVDLSKLNDQISRAGLLATEVKTALASAPAAVIAATQASVDAATVALTAANDATAAAIAPPAA